jgi:electron transport complex protein RnfE
MTEEQNSGQAAQEFLKGLWKENPVFVAVLGMCPALGSDQYSHQCTGHGIGHHLRTDQFKYFGQSAQK